MKLRLESAFCVLSFFLLASVHALDAAQLKQEIASENTNLGVRVIPCDGFQLPSYDLPARIWCWIMSIYNTMPSDDCPSLQLFPGDGVNAAPPPLVLLVDSSGADGSWIGKNLNFAGTGLTDAFVTSFSMILVTEIGDETFIIAALMAMRHPRAVVLAGALCALAIMTVLSTGLGVIVPNLISRKATNSAATILYTFFGLRLLYIAWKSGANDNTQKEMEEVEEKLEEADSQGKTKSRSFRRFFSRFCTPIFLEAFVLTFLAEWGDRSQIATIALASHKNPVGVTVGATLGHVVCTSLAVVGGRLLALRISQRTVATVGGLLFLVFAFHSYFNPPL